MGAPGVRVLVNHFDWPAVGHLVEALAVVNGLHAADPAAEISLAVNARSPLELAGLLPAVSAVHPVPCSMVDGSGVRRAVAALPRDGFDWVVDNFASTDPHRLAAAKGFRRWYRRCRSRLRPRNGWALASFEPPAYVAGAPLALELPEGEIEVARRRFPATAFRVAVLLSGAQDRALYPSCRSWRMILESLRRELGEVVFCFIGRHGTGDGRTTSSLSDRELGALLAAFPDSVSGFDLPLVSQLAAMQQCHLVVGPHSGMMMAAAAVRAPCLYLAGNRYPENWFNPGVPFYSVLPDRRFPCYPSGGEPLAMTAEDTDGEGARSLSMCAARFEVDLDEIAYAARGLATGSWSYDDAMYHHFRRLVDVYGGDTARVATFDAAHARYIDDLFLRGRTVTLPSPRPVATGQAL